MGCGRADEAGPSLAWDVEEASAGNGRVQSRVPIFFQTEEIRSKTFLSLTRCLENNFHLLNRFTMLCFVLLITPNSLHLVNLVFTITCHFISACFAPE